RAWTGSGSAPASFPSPKRSCRPRSAAVPAWVSSAGAAAPRSGAPPGAEAPAPPSLAASTDRRRGGMRITALAGGTGAAQLLRRLARAIDPRALTVIVNTGDDAEVWGLHVSPDLDTVCYTLGGVIDEAKGWGLRDETFHALDQIARFGEPAWFNLGDRDLATHLHRTRRLRAGQTLTAITRDIAQALGVTATVLPMSDDPVRTRILGPDGWLAFQEYFVREKAQVDVRAVSYAGAPRATPAPGVLDALRNADAVLVCPSNPITSIGPILAVPGIVEALQATD